MGYWGDPFHEVTFEGGKKITRTFVHHYPTKVFQSKEEYLKEIADRKLEPNRKVLIKVREEKEEKDGGR
jgi:hypothetical protein